MNDNSIPREKLLSDRFAYNPALPVTHHWFTELPAPTSCVDGSVTSGNAFAHYAERYVEWCRANHQITSIKRVMQLADCSELDAVLIIANILQSLEQRQLSSVFPVPIYEVNHVQQR